MALQRAAICCSSRSRFEFCATYCAVLCGTVFRVINATVSSEKVCDEVVGRTPATNRFFSMLYLTCGTIFLLLFVFLISSILRHHPALLHRHALILDRLLTFLIAFSTLVLNPSLVALWPSAVSIVC